MGLGNSKSYKDFEMYPILCKEKKHNSILGYNENMSYKEKKYA